MTVKLSNVINAMKHYAAKKDIRYYLNGIAFYHYDGAIKYVAASDGHSLAFLKVDADSLFPITACDGCTIIDNDDLGKMLACLGDHFLPEVLISQITGLGIAPIDGKYPDITRVIPKTNRNADVQGGINFDVRLLAKMDKFSRALVKGIKPAIMTDHHYRLHFGDKNGACLAELDAHGCHVDIITMPAFEKK